MVFLKNFKLLNESQEYYLYDPRTIFNSVYPLQIFPKKELENIYFSDITIFYGGNGSGKSTLLNIIGEKLSAERKSSFNKGEYFSRYVERCDYEVGRQNPIEIKIITSDDIFDTLLDIRAINSGVNRKKSELCKEFLENKYSDYDLGIYEYDALKKQTDAKRKSMSKFIRGRLVNNNIIEQSNGESALLYWEREIKENSIYILDEPENSLSAENQVKLKKFIEESTRFYNCQFIISTHSPFLLSLENASIYNLDVVPAVTTKWTDLANVRIYHDFFEEHRDKF